MRRIPGLSLSFLLIAILIVPAGTIAAPDPEPASEPQSAPPLDDGPPVVTSPMRTQILDAPLERVRTELMALMREDGLVLAEESTAEGTFVTELLAFNGEKFGADVSIPPPRLSARYPYAQLNEMTSGRYGLEGRLSMLSARRTRLDLRALLEAQGLDRRVNIVRWISRLSNGEVERQYFTKLALRLLEPPSVHPPSR